MPTPIIWPVSTPTSAATPATSSDASLGIDVGSFVGDPAGIDPGFGLISGIDAVAQCVARRLLTPRGTLVDAPDVGIDLRSYLNEAITDAMLSQIRSDVVQEATGDERVLDAAAEVSFDATTGTLTVQVQGDTATGPFQLALAVTSMTATLLQAE